MHFEVFFTRIRYDHERTKRSGTLYFLRSFIREMLFFVHLDGCQYRPIFERMRSDPFLKRIVCSGTLLVTRQEINAHSSYLRIIWHSNSGIMVSISHTAKKSVGNWKTLFVFVLVSVMDIGGVHPCWIETVGSAFEHEEMKIDALDIKVFW